MDTMRDLTSLPKAHLHLHFTGSLRVPSLVDMARARGVTLPGTLTDADPLRVPADQRGWFRFQRQYDAARTTARAASYWRWKRNQPRWSAGTRSGSASVSVPGSVTPRALAMSTSDGTRNDPVKCRWRCALGRLVRSRIVSILPQIGAGRAPWEVVVNYDHGADERAGAGGAAD